MTWFQNKRVVVPIDFSKQANAVVDAVLEMGVENKNLHVIHVAPELTTMTPGVVWDELTDESRQENIERTFHDVFGSDSYRGVTFDVGFGDAGQQIANYAEEVQADFIAMSSHGRTGIKRIMLGSVAERVLRLAHCGVLVLKGK